MWLIVGDLHLTDQARDAYRYDIFDWIGRQQSKREVAATFLAGDLTDAKDRHSATLVNKVIAGLTMLKPPVYICLGNHDYRDPKNPFFKFLNHISGLKFIIKPTTITAGRTIGVIPHCRTQDEFDRRIGLLIDPRPDCFLLHQTFDGAIAETGARLSGLAASPIESLKPRLGIYAGDVHKPQRQGLVTYVGCPYHVRFGDAYEPRALWLDSKGKQTDLHFPAPRKWSLSVRGPENILSNKNLYEGDQVKLQIELTREEVVDWKQIRAGVLAACKKLKLEVYGVKLEVSAAKRRERITLNKDQSHGSTFQQFCTSENLPNTIRKTGMQLLGND